MKIQIRKYCECGNKIEGHRKRWCSQICYAEYRRDYLATHYLKNHPKLPDRICVYCGSDFSPRQIRHTCCTRKCREKYSLLLQRQKTKLRKVESKEAINKWSSYGYIFRKPIGEVREINESKSTANSKYQKEIEEYLKNGGTVKTIAPEISGKTPGASPQNQIMADWNIDDLMGFGYSNIFMEELDLEYNHGGFDVG